ncbi:DoxX family membrane protein [Pontibacter sp. BT310]|uniref:DoxX family membrane protein n=1 Tax=Pontibacter populi TaxID=890055 RepID=A0ABS6XCJ4_9BACT|nr:MULTISPECIES: DoxX family membrane protein [Pontibacter]MBJ6118871.1 DoxX family membrane protein [Pontibacter sp. BT310]MBR0571299.1 DoxX family membrane protein [Microvirga sp. STS03]MBW3365725.1 DoxX family membrane protein [Pontibacter populi]
MSEDKYLPYGVLFMRLALAFTLLAAIADKAGYWGEPGSPTIIWGDWHVYINYMHALLPFTSKGMTEMLATVATVLEGVLALMLLIGIKVRWAALGTGIYSLFLALGTLVFIGVKAPFNYSLFVVCAAGFLLACCPIYRFTAHGIKKRSTYHPY